MKKFKITKGDRVYIVDAKSHIDAISKVKAVKDSSIKDYSPEVYVKELEKLIPQYQRLDELRHKIIESLENTNKINNDTWRKYDYLSDAKVKQYIKQVRELDKKWNSITSNLSRFNIDPYNQRLDVSDRDIWFDNLPDKSTVDSIKYAVERKAKKYKSSEDIWKDSISQWNPGMSEIGLFQISYKRNGVYQSILVRANSEEQAKQKLLNNLNGVDIIGVNSHPSPHFHEPILDSSIKDDGYYYLLRDAIDLLTKPGAARGWSQPYLEEVQEYMVQKGINPTNVNQWKKKYESLTKDSSIKDSGINYGTLFIDLNSPNELTASRIVQELKKEIGNNKIAEIRGGSFTPLREYGSAGLDLDFKEFKNNEWGTNHIRLSVHPELSLPVLMKMKDDPKSAYKLRAELNSKLKQFANKTIYSNKSFTMDSSIKDGWSGIRSNGVIFNYSDGKYTITHKNGKVETFPGNKFNTAEELFKYIDNIKDSVIKDMPLMFKSNVNMQSLKSNIDNVKNKPNETYINSLNANIQGIIADIEEIKGYEKEGKFNESPALKFSCKNLTAQYYKLLNDPKLQGTLHKLDVPTYKNVLYAEHQAQMLSQVTLKDSAIKDEHIVFRNRVKPEDLVQSLRKSKTDSTFESVAIGNISEIIADFKADFANSKLDRIAVVSHYKEYRRNAEHWRDQVPATVRNKLDEMMRVIPA